MAAKLFLVLLLAVAANGMPKMTPDLKEKILAEKASSLLMPGPVILPNETNMVTHIEPVDASPQCILCEYIMEKLDQMLTQNSTEEEIKQALEKVCSVLPSSVTTECKEFIDQYADVILEYLSKGLSPKLVCKELGICTDTNTINELPKKVVFPVDMKDIGDAQQCEICEAIVQQIEKLITINSTQQEIEQAFEEVCSLLPAEITTKCDQFVEKYLPEILNVFALEVTPAMLCKALGVCTSSSKTVLIEEVKMGSKESNISCEVCKKLIEIAKDLASKNQTVTLDETCTMESGDDELMWITQDTFSKESSFMEEDIEDTLKIICDFMLPVYKECKDFVDEVIPEIFNELAKMDPEAICEQLELCPAFDKHNDIRCFLTGISRCSNLVLAKKCGDLDYCKMMELGQK